MQSKAIAFERRAVSQAEAPLSLATVTEQHNEEGGVGQFSSLRLLVFPAPLLPILLEALLLNLSTYGTTTLMQDLLSERSADLQ